MSASNNRDQWRDGPRERELRAADRDRDAIADILREEHVAGRLESEEFQERIDRCYSAKTYSELDGLIADLPAEPRAHPRSRPPRWPALALVPVLIALLVLSQGRLLWVAIPLFFFVVRPGLLGSRGGARFGWGCWSSGARGNL
ncbi:MAG: DUF1707 domain-containing protein [Solirubrobacterales bacterium]|nr:DUF1707 domain-containing protein [Solirubrobacterales bacterium]MBV9049779.1 DUF1707 domain-containing protein [Solirubrobacterales bacterium]